MSRPNYLLKNKDLKVQVRRAQIARSGGFSLREYQAGKLRSFTAEELIEKLNMLPK